MKQLIDLNGDLTNFDLTFTATSKDGSPFELLVVDQTTLDSNPSLEYKKAEGTISGNIISDKGVYQNYFLLLKSDTPTECEVSIELKEIPKRKAQPLVSHEQKLSSVSQLQAPKSTVNWFVVLAFILGACVLLWYFYDNKKNNSDESIPDSLLSLSFNQFQPTQPTQPPKPTEYFNLGESSILPNKNLLDRLSKLKINKT